MDVCNKSIKCEVRECEHNVSGRNCSLNCVKIACGNAGCSTCESFRNKY